MGMTEKPGQPAAVSSTAHRTLFFGVFVDLPPAPAPWEKEKEVEGEEASCSLRIRHGLLWISPVDGTIEGHDWGVQTEGDLARFLAERSWAEERQGGERNEDEPRDASATETVRVVRSNAARNGFFFPGFVDTHIHASQYPNCGLFGKSSLLNWLENYTFPLESSFGPRRDDEVNHTDEDEKLAQRVRMIYDRVVQRTLSHGTTCASYYATIHVAATNTLAKICAERGQRALIGRVCMDDKRICPAHYRDESGDASIAATAQTIAYIRSLDPSGALVRPVVTPRFAPSCTPDTLSRLAALANTTTQPQQQQLMIQTHLSENADEVALVKSLFPTAQSYTHLYDHHGLLTPRTMLAHAIHISPAERALLRQRRVGLSHCPASNAAIGSGLCRVRALLDDGIAVGLGTDVSAGYSASILEAVRQTCLTSRLVGFSTDFVAEKKNNNYYYNNNNNNNNNAAAVAVAVADVADGREKLSVEEALYLATRGGARLVNLDGPGGVGGFDIGRSFDAQMIELGPDVNSEAADEERIIVNGHTVNSSLGYWNIDLFGDESWEEKIEKWVWKGDDRNVQRVWVRGRLVHSKPY